MEGEGRKKRKLENEEENEEETMEKFFALIKSTKDVRDLLSKEKTDKNVEEEKEKVIWHPTFQPEDFIDHGELGKSKNISSSTQGAGPSEKEKTEKEVTEKELPEANQAAAAAAAAPVAENTEDKEKASDRLDLNLSL